MITSGGGVGWGGVGFNLIYVQHKKFKKKKKKKLN